jgi:hypothetical protein
MRYSPVCDVLSDAIACAQERAAGSAAMAGRRDDVPATLINMFGRVLMFTLHPSTQPNIDSTATNLFMVQHVLRHPLV